MQQHSYIGHARPGTRRTWNFSNGFPFIVLGIQNGKNAEKAWERGKSRRLLEHCDTPPQYVDILLNVLLFPQIAILEQGTVGKASKMSLFFPRVARVGKVTGTHYIGFRGPVYSGVAGARKCDHIQYSSLKFSSWSWFHCLKGPKRRRSKDLGHTCWLYLQKKR